MQNISSKTRHSKRETQRSAVSDLKPRFARPKQGSKSLVPLRFTRVWNDDEGLF
jgi:hypothetical protein